LILTATAVYVTGANGYAESDPPSCQCSCFAQQLFMPSLGLLAFVKELGKARPLPAGRYYPPIFSIITGPRHCVRIRSCLGHIRRHKSRARTAVPGETLLTVQTRRFCAQHQLHGVAEFGQHPRFANEGGIFVVAGVSDTPQSATALGEGSQSQRPALSQSRGQAPVLQGFYCVCMASSSCRVEGAKLTAVPSGGTLYQPVFHHAGR